MWHIGKAWKMLGKEMNASLLKPLVEGDYFWEYILRSSNLKRKLIIICNPSTLTEQVQTSFVSLHFV